MNQNGHTVFIVDDDEAVRDSLHELLDSVGIDSVQFNSGQSFLDHFQDDMQGCLVLDIRMPGMSGLELQEELIARNCVLPIIFITGHGDVPMAVEAMKKGAVEFIQKPFRDQELLDCINSSLQLSTQEQQTRDEKALVETLKNSLTARETEILEAIVDGQANKVIAANLGISQRTVENHRASIIEKMKVRSTAQLIKLVVSARDS